MCGVLTVPVAYGSVYGRVRLGTLPKSEVPVYFLEHHHYYDREYLYGSPTDAYPDIVHASDGQTALVPVYVNTVEWAQPLHGAASIYTIHNLALQQFSREWR
jgi:starch synthase